MQSIQVVKGVIYKEPGERGLSVKHPSPACKRDANYSYGVNILLRLAFG